MSVVWSTTYLHFISKKQSLIKYARSQSLSVKHIVLNVLLNIFFFKTHPWASGGPGVTRGLLPAEYRSKFKEFFEKNSILFVVFTNSMFFATGKFCHPLDKSLQTPMYMSKAVRNFLFEQTKFYAAFELYLIFVG